jgi:soluble cytochrome b562
MLSITKCLIAGAAAALFTTARAEATKGACKADVEKLCKDVQPGEGRLLTCLEEHKAKVSPKCQSNLKQVKQALKQVSDACEPDIERFCFNVPMGKGGIAKCLKQHSADLTPGCKDAVAKVKAEAQKAK